MAACEYTAEGTDNINSERNPSDKSGIEKPIEKKSNLVVPKAVQ